MMNLEQEVKRIAELDAKGLLPCPSCRNKAVIGLGKRGSCQLHGEPFQGVTVSCTNRDCRAPLRVEAGDIFNGGEPKSKAEAIILWNKHAKTPALQLIAKLWEEREQLREGLVKAREAMREARSELLEHGVTDYELIDAITHIDGLLNTEQHK